MCPLPPNPPQMLSFGAGLGDCKVEWMGGLIRRCRNRRRRGMLMWLGRGRRSRMPKLLLVERFRRGRWEATEGLTWDEVASTV